MKQNARVFVAARKETQMETSHSLLNHSSSSDANNDTRTDPGVWRVVGGEEEGGREGRRGLPGEGRRGERK